MIYGIAMLLIVLGLLVASSALRKIIRMQKIKRNSRRTQGTVESTASAMNTGGWLLGAVSASEMVNHQRPLVSYHPDAGTEMSIEFVPSNFLSGRKYRAGDFVDVAYDRAEPWRAFVVREWAAAWRDAWLGSALSILGIFLWVAGRIYDMPF
jgi:hypothetical protein